MIGRFAGVRGIVRAVLLWAFSPDQLDSPGRSHESRLWVSWQQDPKAMSMLKLEKGE